MGTRGRPPKPVALRLIEGNPGKRAIKDDALKIGGPPTPTRTLRAETRAIWDRLVKYMPAGVWNCCDSDLLMAYCEIVALHDRATIALNAAPSITVTNRNGEPALNPLVRVQMETAMKMVSLGSRLGLDPLARQSIKAPSEPKFNKFVSRDTFPGPEDDDD
ncbi:phage terminase small subunit P27 family [Brevundimonas sp. DC300-4]|uniref:phage terminase small subunit P27 family n=1 Tax=Brevundimonas sp. DC300-4 TaxID=2804594 RepID=UPI003CE95336